MAPKTNYLEQILGKNPDAVSAIREIPFFRNSSDSLLQLIYRYGRIFALNYNEALTREHEFDQWVFFVLDGRLAVYVGEDRVDTISSSLVGERCILGEPRKATLRAAEEGMTALGVDMAILDTLQQAGEQNAENASVFVELLAAIAGEIVRRVSDRCYTHFDITGKQVTYLNLEKSSEIVEELRQNAYRTDPRANLEVYKFVQRADRALLALCREGGSLEVDTRKLYALCMNAGRQQLIRDLAGALRLSLKAPQPGARNPEPSGAGRADYSFPDFSARTFAALGEGTAEGTRKQIPKAEWRRYFQAGTELAVDLGKICNWLKKNAGFSDLELVDTLMVILKEASEYTAAINASIKSAVREIGQIEFITQVEAGGRSIDVPIAEFLETRSPEELIPMFSKHVLEVHLIHPYLDELGLSPPMPVEPGEAMEGLIAEPEAEEASAQDVANSLFD